MIFLYSKFKWLKCLLCCLLHTIRGYLSKCIVSTVERSAALINAHAWHAKPTFIFWVSFRVSNVSLAKNIIIPSESRFWEFWKTSYLFHWCSDFSFDRFRPDATSAHRPKSIQTELNVRRFTTRHWVYFSDVSFFLLLNVERLRINN